VVPIVSAEIIMNILHFASNSNGRENHCISHILLLFLAIYEDIVLT
jgi:hypothetical protein